MALKRLKMLSPSAARQLFGAMVAPVIDYASNVWMHACKGPEVPAMNRAQREGAQSVIGAFRTVAVAIAEAEAHIRPIRQRHSERATKLWIGMQTLPATNPLQRIDVKVFQRFTSPLTKISLAHQQTNTLETIQAYTIPPWQKRLDTVIRPNNKEAVEAIRQTQGIILATSSSVQNGIVGIGSAVCNTTSTRPLT
jgi:hypothetical protein